jgi:hypothetical protein
MKKLISIITIALLIIGNVNSQLSHKFQNTIWNSEGDFNHFSIETIKEDQSYVIGGTLFTASGNDIYVIKVDKNGRLIWEQRLDFSSDDRILDVTIGNNKNIIVTGYIMDDTQNLSLLYIAEFDFFGTLIKDKKLPIEFEKDNNSIGTNVIYNEPTDSYIVGGFCLVGGIQYDPLTLTEYKSFVLSISSDFNRVNWCTRLFNTQGQMANAVNDIINIENDKIFITGALGFVDQGYTKQGVLAAFLDVSNGSITNNLSFTSACLSASSCRSWFHHGNSCFYDSDVDKIFLLSTQADKHTIQLTTIKDVMSSPVIDLNRNESTGALSEGNGYQIMKYEDNSFIVVGGHNQDANFFTARISYNLNPIGTGVFSDHLAPGIKSIGGSLLSSHNTSYYKSFMYNQEILAKNITGNELVAIGPYKHITNSFGLELFSGIRLKPSCNNTFGFNFSDIRKVDLLLVSDYVDVTPENINESSLSVSCEEYANCCYPPFNSFQNAVTDIFTLANKNVITTDFGSDYYTDLEYDDLNEDGLIDVLYTNGSSLFILEGTNSSGFTIYTNAPRALNLNNCYSSRMFDWDGDGDLDIVSLNIYLGTKGVYVYENVGSGVINTVPFATLLTAPNDFPLNTSPTGKNGCYLEVGDLNNDGFPDVLLSYMKQINYYQNNGSGSVILSTPQTYSIAGGYGASPFVQSPASSSLPVPELFDIDCDGDLDLFISDTRGSNTLIPNGRMYFHENQGVTPSGKPIIATVGLTNAFGLDDQPTLDLHDDVVVTRFVHSCKDLDNIIAIAYTPGNRQLYYYRYMPISFCPQLYTPSAMVIQNNDINDKEIKIHKKISKDFIVFPNPFSNIINITSTSNIDKITIYGVDGVLKYEGLSPKKEIKLDFLNNGVYFVKVVVE